MVYYSKNQNSFPFKMSTVKLDRLDTDKFSWILWNLMGAIFGVFKMSSMQDTLLKENEKQKANKLNDDLFQEEKLQG